MKRLVPRLIYLISSNWNQPDDTQYSLNWLFRKPKLCGLCRWFGGEGCGLEKDKERKGWEKGILSTWWISLLLALWSKGCTESIISKESHSVMLADGLQ